MDNNGTVVTLEQLAAEDLKRRASRSAQKINTRTRKGF